MDFWRMFWTGLSLMLTGIFAAAALHSAGLLKPVPVLEWPISAGAAAVFLILGMLNINPYRND